MTDKALGETTWIAYWENMPGMQSQRYPTPAFADQTDGLRQQFAKMESAVLALAERQSNLDNLPPYDERERIPLCEGYHAQAGETRTHLHDVYTTKGELYGYDRIHVGTLMKSAVLDLQAACTARPVGEDALRNAAVKVLGATDDLGDLFAAVDELERVVRATPLATPTQPAAGQEAVDAFESGRRTGLEEAAQIADRFSFAASVATTVRALARSTPAPQSDTGEATRG